VAFVSHLLQFCFELADFLFSLLSVLFSGRRALAALLGCQADSLATHGRLLRCRICRVWVLDVLERFEMIALFVCIVVTWGVTFAGLRR